MRSMDEPQLASPEPGSGPPGLAQFGMVIALLAVFALFIGLVLAYVFYVANQSDAPRVTLPWLIWPSTVVLVVSSVTLEWARRALLEARAARYRKRLSLTLALGTAFLVLQIGVGWLLLERGVPWRDSARGSALYVFILLHALHLLGGHVYLLWLSWRARRLEAPWLPHYLQHRTAAATVAIYWHAMGLLWLLLVGFLWYWSGR